MNFIEQHKAALITALLSGILVLGLFSIQLKRHQKLITESYYLLQPEPEPKLIEDILQEPEDLKGASTNKAFNEDEAYKDMMRNFKTLSANDFQRTTKTLEEEKSKDAEEQTTETVSYSSSTTLALNAKETEAYKTLQAELKKRLENKKQAAAHAKTKSTLTYSLKGRTLTYYKTPRYLCEYGGKIVVTISVNSLGDVNDAYINGASNSSNQCLIESALTYAKSAQFDASEQSNQIGTITFLFKGKH